MRGGIQEVEVRGLADDPGLTLCRCHLQLHKESGFVALFDHA